MTTSMRLGVMSDSHGRVETTRKAVEALLARGANVIVHLGDIGTDAVIDELVGHPARIVFGNMDLDHERLARYAEAVDVCVDHPMGVIESGARRAAFTHGHVPELMRKAIEDGVDYLLHGHTHELRDERIGQTRIINPGALFRARRYTAAVLDLAMDSLDIIEIAR